MGARGRLGPVNGHPERRSLAHDPRVLPVLVPRRRWSPPASWPWARAVAPRIRRPQEADLQGQVSALRFTKGHYTVKAGTYRVTMINPSGASFPHQLEMTRSGKETKTQKLYRASTPPSRSSSRRAPTSLLSRRRPPGRGVKGRSPSSRREAAARPRYVAAGPRRRSATSSTAPIARMQLVLRQAAGQARAQERARDRGGGRRTTSSAPVGPADGRWPQRAGDPDQEADRDVRADGAQRRPRRRAAAAPASASDPRISPTIPPSRPMPAPLATATRMSSVCCSAERGVARGAGLLRSSPDPADTAARRRSRSAARAPGSTPER